MNTLINNVKTHEDELKKLIDILYGKNEKIYITFEDEKIQYEVNGCTQNIDKNLYQLLNSIMKNTNCIRISLYKDEYNNSIIELIIENKDPYGLRLCYFGDNIKEYEESWTKITNNWYYDVLMYD